ncbi:PPOX class F420-dependent oxidoreductase, partial [Streptomyces sp. SID10244]|nr:PPOX class F420-dependent oxidoreductase [Streptomyces sp. SID10244]
KSLIRVTPTRWGPVATGGFPADVATRLDEQDG